MLCAYCGENQRSAGDYVRHCREVHDGKFEDFDETFASMAEFEVASLTSLVSGIVIYANLGIPRKTSAREEYRVRCDERPEQESRRLRVLATRVRPVREAGWTLETEVDTEMRPLVHRTLAHEAVCRRPSAGYWLP